MSQLEKLIEKFLENPNSIKFSKIEKILKHFNFKRIEAKGSHIKFKHHKLKYDLIIPLHNNDCKNFYKELTVKIIKNLNEND